MNEKENFRNELRRCLPQSGKMEYDLLKLAKLRKRYRSKGVDVGWAECGKMMEEIQTAAKGPEIIPQLAQVPVPPAPPPVRDYSRTEAELEKYAEKLGWKSTDGPYPCVWRNRPAGHRCLWSVRWNDGGKVLPPGHLFSGPWTPQMREFYDADIAARGHKHLGLDRMPEYTWPFSKQMKPGQFQAIKERPGSWGRPDWAKK